MVLWNEERGGRERQGNIWSAGSARIAMQMNKNSLPLLLINSFSFSLFSLLSASIDPYLAFFFQGRRKFTNVAVKGGVKPEWNQEVTLLAPSLSGRYC